MQFVEVILKNGKSMLGYITNTYGSQIQMLVLKDEALTFTSFSKSALNKINEIRQLTPKEIKYIQGYTDYSKDISDANYQIRNLQSHVEHIRGERDKAVEELLKLALQLQRNENDILTVADLEEFLTETGFKNLFLMQRYHVLVLGEHEELLYLNGHQQMIPLLVKQAKEVASLLNQKELTKELASNSLSQYASEAKQAKVSATHGAKTEGEEEAKTGNPKTPVRLKITDIQDKLNEHGFQTLRKLQENRLILIREDGTLDFGDIENIPFFKEALHNPKLLADVLNQPMTAPPIIPFPIIKGMDGFLKQLERQLKPSHPENK